MRSGGIRTSHPRIETLGRQDAVMRFEHTPGEKLFVDYAGKTMAVADRHIGEIRVPWIRLIGWSALTDRVPLLQNWTNRNRVPGLPMSSIEQSPSLMAST